MLDISIRGFGELSLESLVLDLNGTIAYNGALIPDLPLVINQLKPLLSIYLLSADTFGKAEAIAKQLGITFVQLDPTQNEAESKLKFVQTLGVDRVVALGNGANDELMLKNVRLGIGVMGAEGIATQTLLAAKLVVKSPINGLRLLLNPKMLTATLRS